MAANFERSTMLLPLFVLFIAPSAMGQLSLSEMLAQHFPGHQQQTTTSEVPFTGGAYESLHQNIPLSNDPRYDPRSSALVTKSVLKLAHDITEKTIQNNPNTDFQVISPVSIAAALSLVLLSARGQTHQEMIQTFGYDSDEFLSSTPYKIHEEFGLLLEDMLNDMPNENRTRWATPWKHNGVRGFVPNESRFNFPDETFKENVLAIRAKESDSMETAPPTQGGSSRALTRTTDEMEHKIYVANGIFIQNGFSILPDYRTVVDSIYKSQLVTLDFAHKPQEAAQYINKWVQRSTRNRIKDIVEASIAPETKVIIANALYFKALWDTAFFEGGTGRKNFYPDGLGGPSVEVDMMSNGGKFPHYYSQEFDCDILGLPYKRKLTTMYIILPRNSNRQKLQQIQSQLTPDIIEDMIQRMEIKTAIILFPKLHLTSSTDLVQILSTLGMHTLFDPHASDLGLLSNGIDTAPSLFATSRKRRSTSYKVEATNKRASEPLNLKDFILSKRITKSNPDKKKLRARRETEESYTDQALRSLDYLRQTLESPNPGLYVGQVLHKVDLTINEKGTEGGAATSVTLNRTGTKVVMRCEAPFMFLIRHDETKLPIFYGAIFRPQN